MSVELTIIIVQFLLLIGQQVFWMKNVQALIDKSMSKSYAEYVSVEQFKSASKDNRKEEKKPEPEVDEYSIAQADKANTLFGIKG